jgi:hypothetical protein
MNRSVDVLISGAGITGIFAALHCHSRGISSAIHESRPAPGGILRDWSVEDDWYFRNCQYLTPGTDWFSLLPQNHLLTFPHTYGSFTDLWGENCAFPGFAGPVYSLKSSPGVLRETAAISLCDRLSMYPEDIALPLINWVKRFGISPHEIHASAATGFQISRVFPARFAADIRTYKAKNKIADNLYGIPREYLGLGPAMAALPQNGFSNYFKEIAKNLIDKTIHLELGSTIKGTFISRHLDSENSGFFKPAVIWTGNPIPLIRQITRHSLEAPCFKMRNIVTKWNHNSFRHPFYIQVFSQYRPITRIFIYYNKATIECFDDHCATPEVVSCALEILESFLPQKLPYPDEAHAFTENRHFLCSVKDYQYLEEFVGSCPYRGLIPSPWHLYGREAKIENVLSSIDQKL